MSPNVRNNSVSGPTLLSGISLRIYNEVTELNNGQELDEELFALNVYEDKLVRSPQIEITFSDKFKAIAVLDTRSEVNLLSERVYRNVVTAGIDVRVYYR
jgi:hypothetical protein